MQILEKIFSVKNRDGHKVWNICGLQIKYKNTNSRFKTIETRLHALETELTAHINETKHIHNIILENIHIFSLNYISLKNYLERCRAITQLHTKMLTPYKNRYDGKDIFIIATGSTLKYFKQNEEGIYIGVNKSFLTDIKLDYLFMQDYKATQSYIEKAQDYPCTKFYGIFIDENLNRDIGIPMEIREKANAKSYYNNFPCQEIYYDIENNALMDFSSIAFAAIHFALYTGSKRIHLVGCDCSNNGYYDNSIQSFQIDTERTIKGYKKLKEFCSLYYPDTEIISINPIGLKGIFNDKYTESFLNEHPEIDKYNVEII